MREHYSESYTNATLTSQYPAYAIKRVSIQRHGEGHKPTFPGGKRPQERDSATDVRRIKQSVLCYECSNIR